MELEAAKPIEEQEKERPHLGLVCMTFSEEVRFRTITRTRYLKLSEEEQKGTLRDLYSDNLRRLFTALDYCEQHAIKLYRLSSALFPMSDEDLGTSVLLEMKDELAKVGERANRNGMRIVIHPDQFVVLNSDTLRVIETSIKILEKFALQLDLMNLPRTNWTVMMIHGGKSNKSDLLVETILSLPENVRSRLAFENDEYAYSAAQILDVCHRAKVPMVFDLHHFVVNEKLDSYEHPSVGEMLKAAQTTWPVPEWQLVHISNGKESFNDRRHSGFITVVPSVLKDAPWIEVEAKNKEQAIEQLRADWPLAD